MKLKLTRKTLCIFLTLAVVIAALPLGLISVSAKELQAPELSNVAGHFCYGDTAGNVSSAEVGEAYNSFRINGQLPKDAYSPSEGRTIMGKGTYDYIEFDVYIEDYDAFIHSLKYDADGNPLEKANSLMFNLSPRGDYALAAQGYQWWHLENQITKSGWNHIILNLYNNAAATDLYPNVTSSPGPSGGADNRMYTLFVGEDCGVLFDQNGRKSLEPVTQSNTSTEIKGDTIALANVCLTTVEAPKHDFSKIGMIAAIGENVMEQTITPDGRDLYANSTRSYSGINSGSNLKSSAKAPVNCTDAEYIELDVFFENPAVLRKTFKADSVEFVLNFFDAAGNTAKYKFMDNMKSGWNHLCIAKGDFTATSFDWAKVASYSFLFEGSGLTTDFIQRKQEMAVANVYATGSKGISFLPVENKTENPLCTSIFFSTMGENADSDIAACEAKLVSANLDSVDLSQNDYIAFDLHINDIAKYNDLIARGAEPKLWLSSSNSSAQNSVGAAFAKYAQKGKDDKWLYFFIPKSDFAAISGTIDWTAVNSCGVVFGNNTLKAGDDYSLELAFVNVGGMTVGKPDAKFGESIFTMITGEKSVLIQKDGFTLESSDFTPGKFTNNDYLEADIYIENYERFNAAKNGGAKLQVTLTNENGETKSFDFTSLVSHKGWNHLAFKRTAGSAGIFNLQKNVVSYKIELSGMPAENDAQNSLLIISDLSITAATQIESEKLVGEEIAMFSETIKHGNLNAAFSSSLSNNSANKTDFSSAMFVEFDFYVQDIDLLKESLKLGGNSITLTLNNNEVPKTTYTADFLQYLKKSGWNHVSVPYSEFKPSTEGKGQVMTGYKVAFSGNTANTNMAAFSTWGIQNIRATGIKLPEVQCDNELLGTVENKSGIATFGKDFKFDLKGAVKGSPIDINGAELIEFDVYVPSIERFKNDFKLGVDGSTIDRTLSFTVYKNNDYTVGLTWNCWTWQIRNDGWNHVQLPISSPQGGDAAFRENPTLGGWRLAASGKAIGENNPLADDMLIICNVSATSLIIPDYPVNSMQKMMDPEVEGKGAVPGPQFHYIQDRGLTYQKFGPYDLSDASSIEFDVYVNGVDELKAASKGSARGEKICFVISSLYRSLWDRYEKHWFLNMASACEFESQLTHNGWNHVKIGLPSFKKWNNQAFNWASISSWGISFINTTNVHWEYNPASDVFVYITNVTSCGYKQDLSEYVIAEDSEMPSQPDKEAVYISTCDGYSDDHGVWNNTTLDKKYRTEGKASLGYNVTYLTEANDIQPTYIFDDTADMSDLSKIKFDLFTDFPQFMGKAGNKARFVVSSNKLGRTDCYSWDVDLTSFNIGWNQVEFDLKDAVKIGNPSLDSIKSVSLKFDSLDLDKETFECFYLVMDNLRYISNNGNTKLKINLPDDDDDEDYEDYDDDEDYDYDDDLDYDDDDDFEDEEENIVVGKGKTKYQKSIKNITKTDYLVFGIIAGAEALVLAAAFVIFIIVRKKKMKKN